MSMLPGGWRPDDPPSTPGVGPSGIRHVLANNLLLIIAGSVVAGVVIVAAINGDVNAHNVGTVALLAVVSTFALWCVVRYGSARGSR